MLLFLVTLIGATIAVVSAVVSKKLPANTLIIFFHIYDSFILFDTELLLAYFNKK
ncbi:hypothetical protein J6P52_01185 [bacterium]|nr:hypothetical protein [bacterium]